MITFLTILLLLQFIIIILYSIHQQVRPVLWRNLVDFVMVLRMTNYYSKYILLDSNIVCIKRGRGCDTHTPFLAAGMVYW